MASSPSTSVHNCFDASIQEAFQKLQDAKQIMVDFEAGSQKLQQDVSSLQLEKETLAKEIVDMKQTLRDLGEELNWDSKSCLDACVHNPRHNRRSLSSRYELWWRRELLPHDWDHRCNPVTAKRRWVQTAPAWFFTWLYERDIIVVFWGLAYCAK